MGSGGQEVGRGRGQAELDGEDATTCGGAACRGEKNITIKCVDRCLFRKNNFASFMSFARNRSNLQSFENICSSITNAIRAQCLCVFKCILREGTWGLENA